MDKSLAEVIDLEAYPLAREDLIAACKRRLDESGALVLANFIKPAAVASIRAEGLKHRHLAYFTLNDHNIYLSPTDPAYPDEHPRNRLVASSKGCITDAQIPADSVLRTLYNAREFRQFMCSILGESELYEYADALSSINLHYASEGQELGWHYDNSSFAITLLIEKPIAGGEFEYAKDTRDADAGDMSFELSGRVLDGDTATEKLAIEPGSLVLFRGRNSMHRVTPVEGAQTRMLVVFAYNTQPGIALSESARMTFYGRIQ